MTSSLETSRRGSVTLLRMSRAAKRNALNPELIAGIKTFFGCPPEGTRAIVLHADGNHFCAGLDLSTITGTTPAAGIHHSRAWHRAFACKLDAARERRRAAREASRAAV